MKNAINTFLRPMKPLGGNDAMRKLSDMIYPLIVVVLLVLKLTGAVNISWWIVLAPLWLPLLVVGIFIVWSVITGNLQESWRQKKKERR